VRSRFAAGMLRLYKSHMLQVDHAHTAVYLEALQGIICLEAFEFAVRESIRLDERFPKIPRLIALGNQWRRPQPPADLSRTALPEITPEQAAINLQRVNELIRKWDAGEIGAGDFDHGATA